MVIHYKMLLLLLLLLVPSALAVDSLGFGNCPKLGLDCPSYEENVSIEDQKQLVLDLLLDRSGGKSPYHNFIQEWNTGLNLDAAPNDILVQSKNTIKNAWMRVLTVMPSFKEGNVYYINDTGMIQTGYSYRLELPTGTEPGDCQTNYVSNTDESYLEIFQNGQKVGDQKLTDFTAVMGENSFEAALHIRNKILVRHYQLKEACKDKKCKWVCTFAGEGYRTDTFDLTDTVKAKRLVPSFSFRGLNFDPPDVGYLEIQAGNLLSYTVNFGRSLFKKKLYQLVMNYSFAPYNILTVDLKKRPTYYVEFVDIVSSTEKEGVERVTFRAAPSLKTSCNLNVEGFFSSDKIPCDFNILPLPVLEIDTDDWLYGKGEPITVTVSLKDSSGYPLQRQVKVMYGGSLKLVESSGEVQFPAQSGANVIEASSPTNFKYGSAKARKVVLVMKHGLRVYLYLALVMLVVVLIYKGVRKLLEARKV